MKRIVLCLILLIVCVLSCDFLLGVKNLGNGYYFDFDQILYTSDNKYNGIGYRVVPATVIFIEYNKNYIIATSQNKIGINQYWFVVKQKKQELYFVKESEELSSYYRCNNIIGPINQNEIKDIKKKYNVPNDLIRIINK